MTARLHLAVEPSTDNEQTLRVILADDHELMRRSLRDLLDGEEDVEVIGEAGELSAAVRRVCEQQPDVMVLDLRMPGGSSLQAIDELGKLAPDINVVVVTMEDNPVFAERAFAAGARGFVLKDRADSELPQAIRAVAQGERFVSPRIAARLEALAPALADGELTPREAEVLRLIALGHTSVEVAGILGISPRTVESHRARVHSKLGLHSRAELVRYALARGLLGT